MSLYLSYYMRTGSILSTRYLVLLFISYCTSMFLWSICVYSKNKLSLSHKPFTNPRWLKIMKNKVKCCQLVTGISVDQLHFVTYWLLILVHHSVTYMACKKVKCFHEKTGKFQFQVGCIYFPPIKQNKSFMDQVGNFCFDIWHWKVISNEKGD